MLRLNKNKSAHDLFPNKKENPTVLRLNNGMAFMLNLKKFWNEP